MAISAVRRACTVLLLVVSAAAAHAQTPAATNPNDQLPNFRVEIVGFIAADFTARVSSDYELRRTLEQGLVGLTVSDDADAISVAEDALADRIQKARAGAK